MISSADFTAHELAVGHATDRLGFTGLTVVRGVNSPFRAAAVSVGRASSTRQFDALNPDHIVGRVDAILFCGGSAMGLDSAAGVVRWMEERNRGFSVGKIVVPIVPAAAVFDLGPLGTSAARPTPEMAYSACQAAEPHGFGEGSVGAGTGTTVGKALGIEHCMKGGLGAFTETAGTLVVSALAVVNAFGSVHAADGRTLAGPRDGKKGFVDVRQAIANGSMRSRFREGAAESGNTTLALVAVNAALSRLQLQQLATAASAALFRRILPAGSSVDGDVVVAISPLKGNSTDNMAAEVLAVQALESAIERAVLTATGTREIPSYSDLAL